ncbi:hypothetical protein F2Q70_00010318 [Brassica cretica]|uniref:Uncharacterized protein n=1 Tax=Brassica cretica TaxID=69181 RepID=A0A3N6RCB8_BRACR|nr:hypothetical protein F2Q70_00010318 [Brassica cretica]KAF3581793.1 hypothetical protein DY000_02031972 [Brassica cretica]
MMALMTNLKPPWDDASSSCSGSDLAMNRTIFKPEDRSCRGRVRCCWPEDELNHHHEPSLIRRMKKSQGGGETRRRAGNGEATTPKLRDRIPPLELSHRYLKTDEPGGELQRRKQSNERKKNVVLTRG